MKRIYLMIMSLVFAFMFISSVSGADCYGEYQPHEVRLNIKPCGVNVSYPKGDNSDTVFCNGRLFVPLEKGAYLMGGELTKSGSLYRISVENTKEFYSLTADSNRPVVFADNGKLYISLYELITPFGYEMLVNLDKNSVQIVKDTPKFERHKIKIAAATANKAYIRLEDIMADGLCDGGNYTADMLERLKYTAEYLYMNNQQYYIAWIPVYANPKAVYWNDVSKEYNLYNSYFLYVLDYMVDHNGHLGVHGYTHQYGNDESSVGWEWGEKTPFNFNEQQRRMRAAKESCQSLGYKEEFFEFPHYDATGEQLLMAEYYFDVICQAYPDSRLQYYVTETTRSGKSVYYLPTPAEYVYFKRDYAIFDRLCNCMNKGYAVSLFYHPMIDDDKFEITTENGERLWSYNEEACLPQLLKYVTDRGYSFAKLG